MGATFEFRLFGPVEAWSDDQRLDLGQPRQRSTAAVLLVEANRVVPAGTLIERVWGERPPASARSALYSYLTRIRAVLRVLDPDGESVRLARAAGGYVLEVDSDAVDLHLFDRLVAEARSTDDADRAAALWSRAMDLRRGDPFQGLASGWLDLMRDTVDRRWLTAVLDRNDVELAQGHHAEMLAGLADLHERQPLDERLAGQLLLAEYRSGRQAEALERYQALRRRLADELGVDPGEELRALHEQILRNDPAVAAARSPRVSDHSSPQPDRTPVTPAHLPLDVSGFAGRAEPLAQLDALLEVTAERRPTAVVVSAVSGTAGVGKTALAVHWAHRVAVQFPDGQLYVNLRGFDPDAPVVDPAEAIRGFLDALGVPAASIPTTVEAQIGLYRSLLARRRMLVVLDNARDAEQVRPLLPGTPTCAAVVTSRNRLTALVATDGAYPLILDALSDAEARTLLAERLGADRVAAEPDAVAAVITACARLPLALAIVCARAQQTHFPLAALAAELDNADDRLDALDAGEPASQLRAVFSWSYAALTPPTARLFRLLGLQPGPDIAAAAAASLADHDLPDGRRQLTELARANLIVEHTPGRYTFHDLLRTYAADLARTHDTTAQRHAAITRLLDHYLHTAYTAEQLLDPHRDPIRLPLTPPSPGTRPEQPASYQEAMAWLTAEHRVLLAALQHAAGEKYDRHAWQLAWTLDTFLYRRGHWPDHCTAWQSALHAARRLAVPAAQADAYRRLSYINLMLDRRAGVDAGLQQALDLYAQAGDADGQAATHRNLASLRQRQGHLSQALGHAERSLALYPASGHDRGLAAALNAVGWYHALLRHHTEALTYCARALALYQRIGNREGTGSAWDSLGYAHHHAGHHDRAVDCYRQALAAARDLGERYYEAEILLHLGDVHHDAGRHEAAREAWNDALDILVRLDHPKAKTARHKLRHLDLPAATPPTPG